MNTRAKTFDATGIAPGGRLFAGDLNLIQDVVAAMTDYTQNVGVQTLLVGDSSLIFAKFGTGEISLSANFRTSGIARGLGGVFAGNYTSTARDAIASGSRPTSLLIYNTTNARFEYNSGTDPAPVWSPVAAVTATGTVSQGTLASRPTPAASGANTWYFATDVNGGTLYYSNAAAWTTVAPGVSQAPQVHAASHHPQTGTDKITMSLAGTAASRPAFGAVAPGTFYFATDTGVTSRSDGSTAWTTTASATGVSAHASTHLSNAADPITWGSVHLFGTLASRPAASASNLGYLYFPTDSPNIYECVAGPSWSTVFTAAAAAHASLHAPGGADALPWTTIHGAGTAASRPAAASTNAGYIYFATDTFVISRSDGAAYTTYGALGAGVRVSSLGMLTIRTPYGNDRHLESGLIAIDASVTFTDAYFVAPNVTLASTGSGGAPSVSSVSGTGFTTSHFNSPAYGGNSYWISEGTDD